ncbi:MAG: hypothetical protein ACPG9Q_01390 [Candidatus Thalassarchaeaceae archaeon]
MRKKSILIAIVMVSSSMAGCTSDNSEDDLSARYQEGYDAGYSDAYDASYDGVAQHHYNEGWDDGWEIANAESHAEIMEMQALASSLNATIASLQSADLSNASILSAYHGLDQLPPVASVLCGFNVAGDDGMPVVFSTQLQVDSVVPESFLVIRSDGESVVPNCATLHPADEPLEQRTVLLTGDFGTYGESPLRVEVTGPLLTFDGESLQGLSTEDITPLEDGPRVVLAERFAPDTNGLAGECPNGTAQVVQLTWEGGVTGPANAALGEDQRLGTWVLLEDGATVNPLALVDDDPDNHVLACVAEDSPAQWVVVHAGLFHDPGDIANPATHAEVADE